MRSIVITSLLMGFMLSGCNRQPAPPPAPPAPEFRPTFPIQEIMGHIIMPNADLLWNSVATNVTAKGIEEIYPKTQDDWERVRNYAVTIVEASNLLLIPGRAVTEPGFKPADPTELSAEQMEQKIKADPALWASHVKQLHDIAMLSIKAIDEKSVDGLIEVGDDLDKACEDCHLEYWYPGEKGRQ